MRQPPSLISLRCAASAQSDQSSLCALREGRDLSFRLTEKTDQTAQSETLLGAKVILLVLSCGGSVIFRYCCIDLSDHLPCLIVSGLGLPESV